MYSVSSTTHYELGLISPYLYCLSHPVNLCNCLETYNVHVYILCSAHSRNLHILSRNP